MLLGVGRAMMSAAFRALVLLLPTTTTTSSTLRLIQAYLNTNTVTPEHQQRHPWYSINLTLPPLLKTTHKMKLPLKTTSSSSSKWHNRDNEEILLLHKKELPVLYTNDPKEVSAWLSENMPPGNSLIGFDVESVPTKGNEESRCFGPAVIQLATTERVMVVHLTSSSGQLIRSSLPLVEEVLLDSSIIKVGCGIDMDIVDLYSISTGCAQARSRLDLGQAFASRQTPGLKTLANEILGLDLPKSLELSTSDWSQFPLSVEQLSYAAYDAWTAAAIASRLASRHPRTFGANALRDSLQDQMSIHELHSRRIVRKRARSILTALLEPHQQASKSLSRDKRRRKMANSPGLPRWKSRLVKELNIILKANRHEVDRGIPFTTLQNIQNQSFTC